MRQACPNCGEARIGSFRYCRLCGLDYDAPVLHAAPEKAEDPAGEFSGSTVSHVSSVAPSQPVVPPDEPFVPFDLFPRESPGGDTPGAVDGHVGAAGQFRTAGGVFTGFIVIGGIVAVFLALLVLRPLG
jgi:hypothetical protein